MLRAQLDFALREQDGSRRESALRALSDELGNAIRGTNQLLTLARSDAQASLPEAFDLGELARTVAIELLPLARARGMDLGVGMPDGPLPAVGHADLLREALLNLLHNALHHGRDRGVVALDVTGDAQGFCVTVTDDGPGIAPELWGRLAQRFSKGRGSRGSGLGLGHRPFGHGAPPRSAGPAARPGRQGFEGRARGPGQEVAGFGVWQASACH